MRLLRGDREVLPDEGLGFGKFGRRFGGYNSGVYVGFGVGVLLL